MLTSVKSLLISCLFWRSFRAFGLNHDGGSLLKSRSWRNNALYNRVLGEPHLFKSYVRMQANSAGTDVGSVDGDNSSGDLETALRKRLDEVIMSPYSRNNVFNSDNEDTSEVKYIFIMSDSTGATATRAIRSLLQQFTVGTEVSASDVRTQLFPRVVTAADAEKVVRLAAERRALVVSTLANESLQAEVGKMCAYAGLQNLDLVGPTIRGLSQFLGQTPLGLGREELRKPLDAAYFQRIQAVEFTMRQDDGALPVNLEQADVVLVAPSRCGKTPLAMYLAQEYNLKVANVPLVVGIPPPPQLLNMDPKKVVGLLCHPALLRQIRLTRIEKAVTSNCTADKSTPLQQSMREMSGGADYASAKYVMADLKSAVDLYKNMGWANIDVSNRAVEDTASRVLQELDDKDTSD